jgi:hypothetical protein
MTAPDLTSPEPSSFSVRLPRPLWIGVAAIVLVVAAIGLRLGVSGYRRRVAVREIERFHGSIQYLHLSGPEWLLEWMNDDRMQWFYDPDHLVFWPDAANLRRRSRHGGVIIPIVEPLIDNDNLKCVLGLPNLKSLDLAFSSVGDAGIKHLNGLRNLEDLRLEGSDVSDASIPILSQMQTLKRLNVEHTRITKSGALALEAALPGCEVRGRHNDPFAELVW